jgi:hypothetical protein
MQRAANTALFNSSYSMGGTEGTRSAPNMPLGHQTAVELKAIRKPPIQEKLTLSPTFPA